MDAMIVVMMMVLQLMSESIAPLCELAIHRLFLSLAQTTPEEHCNHKEDDESEGHEDDRVGLRQVVDQRQTRQQTRLH